MSALGHNSQPLLILQCLLVSVTDTQADSVSGHEVLAGGDLSSRALLPLRLDELPCLGQDPMHPVNTIMQ